MCDKLIEDESANLGFKLDLELIQKAFTENPEVVKDDHVVDTLFSMLYFNKFKALMLNFKRESQQTVASANVVDTVDD